MHGLTILLAIKFLALNDAYEIAREAGKPVLVYMHREDWQGEEKIASAFEGALGGDAERLVFAQFNATDNANAPKAWGVTNLDGGFAVIDLRLDRPISLKVCNAAEMTPEELKKVIGEGLAAFDQNTAIRAVVEAMYEALKKNDVASLRKVLWPAQFNNLPNRFFVDYANTGFKDAQHQESLRIRSIEPREIEDSTRKFQPDVESLWKVQTEFVMDDGKVETYPTVVLKCGDSWYLFPHE